jgi:LacI family transcriptional regulator
MVRTLLCIDNSSEYERSLVRGLIQYSQEHGNCLLLSRVPSTLSAESKRGYRIAQWARDWKADAIIGRWPYDDLLPLSNLDCTVVIQNLTSRQTGFSTITGEYVRTGELAADFFIRRRFVNFAFFGVQDLIWSEERAQGFRNTVKRQGFHYQEYMVRTAPEAESGEIIRWLSGLPKPVAVFCSDDEYALAISEDCRLARIKVPQEVAILGVDNDELLCNISDPPLSSIVQDAEKGGYELGRMLHEQEKEPSGNRPIFVISIKPGVIVQRGSTQQHNVEDKEVGKMLEFIDQNFTREITTSEIFEQAFLCRRAAEIRFKKTTGTTVYKYLINRRIEHLCSLLETSDLSLAECAARSGIFDINYLFHVFKKVKGCSPASWRRSKR